MAGATLWVTIAPAPTLPGRIAVAGSLMGTTTGFLVEDRAAETLSATPTSLPIRRLQRALVAVVVLAGWWATAVAWSTARGADRPPVAVGLQVAVLVGGALAASAVASRVGDLGGEGVAGVVLTLTWYATSLLPPEVWFRMPADPTTVSATRQNAILLTIAIATLVFVSRDPAARRT